MSIKSSKIKTKSKSSSDEDLPKKKRGRPPKKKNDEFSTSIKIDSIENSEDYLKKKAKRIRKHIRAGENDAASELILKSLTSILVDLLPIAEAKYRKDPRQGSAYALNNLISTTRELAADLQANTDKSVVINNIIFNILQPTSQTITTFIIDSNYLIKKELAPHFKDTSKKEAHDAIDKMSKEYAKYFKAILISIQERISETLEGKS